jgi:L-serine dehydratase
MSNLFYSSQKLLELIDTQNLSGIPEAVINSEMQLTNRTKDEIYSEILKRYRVMQEAADTVLNEPSNVKTKIADPSTHKIKDALNNPNLKLLSSRTTLEANMYAIAVMECNASMGRIVAAPTAGSAGILPGCLIAMQKNHNFTDTQIIEAILVSAGIGIVIASISTFSAAQAGCQAEVGASSAMTAAAISHLQGLNPKQIVTAAALSLQNMLGLACDPIGGLVEIPCIKRNGFGVANAFNASDMAAMGLISEIPFDEVVEAMNNVAKNMSPNIRETAKGGLAIAPTAKILLGKYLAKKRATSDNAPATD